MGLGPVCSSRRKLPVRPQELGGQLETLVWTFRCTFAYTFSYFRERFAQPKRNLPINSVLNTNAYNQWKFCYQARRRASTLSPQHSHYTRSVEGHSNNFFFVLLLPLLRSFSETNTSYSAVILHLNEIKIYIIRRPNIDCRNKKLTIHGNLLLCITAIFEICVQNGARARAKRWGKYNDRKNRVYFS